jgi:NAD(P)-dependent dehydrogenase (short-subunit alcohol dehydrogenase family)
MQQNSWQEKAVLITGGCGGVGKAAARRFLSEGANVMLTNVFPWIEYGRLFEEVSKKAIMDVTSMQVNY